MAELLKCWAVYFFTKPVVSLRFSVLVPTKHLILRHTTPYRLFCEGQVAAGANASWHQARGGVQVAAMAYQQFTFKFTPTDRLESYIKLTPLCVSLDCGRKLDYPEQTYADMAG